MNSQTESIPPVAADTPPPVSFAQAMRFWVKLGFVSFGGPAGQIALLHQELVDKRRWISERRFLHALSYCMLLPGPEAQQLVTYMGWLMHRIWGGLLAGLLFVLPSLLLLIGLSALYVSHADQPWMSGVLLGLKPAVIALMLQAMVRMGRRSLTHAWMWALAALAWAGVSAWDWPFPMVVLMSALVGLGVGLRTDRARRCPSDPSTPALQATSAATCPTTSSPGVPINGKEGLAPTAWIDDHTPPAPHLVFRWTRFGTVIAVALACWAVPMGVAVWWLGWSHPLSQMGWFFTKAALLTLGGAYAVLPYVHQGAVVEHGWLSTAQMMDGLALGETTPGPLIMVVAFVGFLGGHAQALSGTTEALWAGVWAACWVTWFTFLPSFAFILAGGPWVEHTRRQTGIRFALAGVSAAVVGVILSLGLTFAQHGFWPRGLSGPIDGIAVGMAVLAVLALTRFQRHVVEVLIVCGAVGVLRSLYFSQTLVAP